MLESEAASGCAAEVVSAVMRGSLSDSDSLLLDSRATASMPVMLSCAHMVWRDECCCHEVDGWLRWDRSEGGVLE